MSKFNPTHQDRRFDDHSSAASSSSEITSASSDLHSAEQMKTLIRSHIIYNAIDLRQGNLGNILLESVNALVQTHKDFPFLIERYDKNYRQKDKVDISELKAAILAGANVNMKHEGWTLLHYAANHQDEELVEYLSTIDDFQIICQTRTDDEFYTPLHLACYKDNTKIVTLLVDGNRSTLSMDNQVADKKKDKALNYTHIPLARAITANKLYHVQQLAEITAKALNPELHVLILRFAVDQGDSHIEIVEYLMSISPYKQQINNLSQLAAEHNTQIVAYLANCTKALREKELSFIKAAKESNKTVIAQLLSDGINPYCQDAQGNSALFHAAARKDIKMCAEIIHAGDVQYPTDDLSSLQESEKIALGQEGLRLLMRSPKALSAFLVARTFITKKKANNLVHNIDQLYEELCDVKQIDPIFTQFIRPIVEVLKFVPNLAINYDPTLSNTSRVDPLSSTETRGMFIPGDTRICIGGNDKYAEVMGTTIHEITHLVCDRVWNNYSNPYASGSKEESDFRRICNHLEEGYRENKNSMDIILQRVFSDHAYPKEKYTKELIVRVPQMIAEYKGEGLKKLEVQAPRLLEFYQNFVLPRCIEFVKENTKDKLYEVSLSNLDTLFGSFSKQFKKNTITKVDAEKNYRLLSDVDKIIRDLEPLKEPKMQIYLAHFLNVKAYYHTQIGVVSKEVLGYSEKAKQICESGIENPDKLSIDELYNQLAEKDHDLPLLYTSISYTFGRMYFYNRHIDKFDQRASKELLQQALHMSDVIETRRGMRSIYKILTRRSILYFSLEDGASLEDLNHAKEGYQALLADSKIYIDADNDNELISLTSDNFHKLMCGRQLVRTYMKLATKVSDTSQKAEYYQKAQEYMNIILFISANDSVEKERIASIYNQIGALFLDKQNPYYNIDEAIRYFQKSCNIEEAKNHGKGKLDYPLAEAHQGLAMCYKTQKQFSLALKHANCSLEVQASMYENEKHPELIKAYECREEIACEVQLSSAFYKWRSIVTKSKDQAATAISV